MKVNKMLTPIIAGRAIKSAVESSSALEVTFGDGSHLRIKTSGTVAAAALNGHVVSQVRQAGQELALDFQNGASVTIPLAEETSSVMLRDATGEMEYAV